MSKKLTGRPVDPNKSKRKKFTTMVNPSLSQKLKIKAVKAGVTVADLLEDMIKKNLAA